METECEYETEEFLFDVQEGGEIEDSGTVLVRNLRSEDSGTEVLEILGEAHEKMAFADVLFSCQDSEVQGQLAAHKAVLSIASEFLKTFFEDTEDCGEVILPQVRTETMSRILQIIYTGEAWFSNMAEVKDVVSGMKLLRIKGLTLLERGERAKAKRGKKRKKSHVIDHDHRQNGTLDVPVENGKENEFGHLNGSSYQSSAIDSGFKVVQPLTDDSGSFIPLTLDLPMRMGDRKRLCIKIPVPSESSKHLVLFHHDAQGNAKRKQYLVVSDNDTITIVIENERLRNEQTRALLKVTDLELDPEDFQF